MTAWAVAVPLWFAALVPGLLALNVAPSPTLFNQAAAWIAWGIVAAAAFAGRAAPSWRAVGGATRALAAGLALTGLAALSSWRVGSLPAALALSAAGTCVAAILVAWLGAAMAHSRTLPSVWFGAWLAAGLASAAVACVQVFAAPWADGDWIARSNAAGRAVGNLRQSNHLASLLLWGAVALVPLVESGWLSRSTGRRVAALAAMALLILAVMLTGSRTGLVGVAVLVLWALVDRRLSRFSRALLAATPLLFALAWALVDWWSTGQPGPAIGTAQRLGQDDVTSGRVAIWRDALRLLAMQPWVGVGFGEFNLAWTLTESPDRSPQLFDHTHNMPLQLWVELGLPLGTLVLGLLGWALWQAWSRARAVEDAAAGAAHRAAFVMVLLMGLHSQFEYPLWYAHFLLPTAFAWGWCLAAQAAAGPQPPAARHASWPAWCGMALVIGGSLMIWDFNRVSTVFAPDDNGTPLAQRIRDGQRSWFFAHHADYARITALEDVAPPATADFRRASHYLLDTRLLIAWARAYAREGDLDRARWIAARLRELRQDSARPFFAPCDDPAVADKPFQCTPPARSFSWKDFR